MSEREDMIYLYRGVWVDCWAFKIRAPLSASMVDVYSDVKRMYQYMSIIKYEFPFVSDGVGISLKNGWYIEWYRDWPAEG